MRAEVSRSVERSRRAAGDWSPARIFLLVAAVWHLPLGVAGLFYDRTFPVGAEAARHAGSAHIFGIFETNGWHSLAAILVGVVALYFTVKARRARDAALAIGVFHIGVVLGLILWDPSTFWIASNMADQFVHAASAIGGTATGLLTPGPPPG